MFQYDAPVPKGRSVKLFARAGVEDLEWPSKSSELNPAEHLSDELNADSSPNITAQLHLVLVELLLGEHQLTSRGVENHLETFWYICVCILRPKSSDHMM